MSMSVRHELDRVFGTYRIRSSDCVPVPRTMARISHGLNPSLRKSSWKEERGYGEWRLQGGLGRRRPGAREGLLDVDDGVRSSAGRSVWTGALARGEVTGRADHPRVGALVDRSRRPRFCPRNAPHLERLLLLRRPPANLR